MKKENISLQFFGFKILHGGISFAFFVILYVVFAYSRVQAAPVAVDDPNIFWSPYTWVSNGSAYKQSPTVGSYINVAFSGDTLALNVDDSFVLNPSQLSVVAFIDGDTPIVRTMADVSAGQITFSTSLSSGDHFARIVIRHNADTSGRWVVVGDTPRSTLRITSIEISDSGAILPLGATPLATRAPRVLYYGDSITEGNGIAGGAYGWNATGPLVGWLLNAEYGVKGYSSSTWYVNFLSGVPDFHYLTSSGSYNTGAWRNYYQGESLLNDVNIPSSGYKDGTPDAIYNNLGINDRALYSFLGDAGVDDFRVRITEWLEEARAAVGGRTAIFMVVPFNYNCTTAIKPDENEVNNARYKNAYLAAFNDHITNSGDTRTYLIDLGEEACQVVVDNGSDHLHPNETGAQLLAQMIVERTEGYILYEDDVQIAAQMNGQAITNNMELPANPPTFTGTAPAGSTLTMTLTQGSSVVDCIATADEDGEWSCAFASALGGGAYTLSITGETSWGEAMDFGTFSVMLTGEDPEEPEVTPSQPGGSDGVQQSISSLLAASGLDSVKLLIIALLAIGAAVALASKQIVSARR